MATSLQSVVRHQGVEVTLDDVDAHVLSLPDAERPRPGDDLEAWYREQIREIIVRKTLYATARQDKLNETDEFRKLRSNVERQKGLDLCIAGEFKARGRLARDDLLAEFDQRSDRFFVPESRLVYHVFRRADDRESVSAAVEELKGLRLQVLQGANFSLLAKKFSDSESRHREGSLGWLSRGTLPAEADDAVFSLSEGVPGEPVVTPQGVHVFYVDMVIPERQLTFEEALPQLREMVLNAYREEVLSEIADQVPDTFGMPSFEEFQTIVNSDDQQKVLLTYDEFPLILGEFLAHLRRLVQENAQPGSPPPVPLSVSASWKALAQLQKGYRAHRFCRTRDLIPTESLSRTMAEWEKNAMIDVQRQKQLRELAKADEGRLRDYYENNLGQFSTPVKWRLQRLRLPLSQNSHRDMEQLEKAASEQRVGLNILQNELGGEIDDLGALGVAGMRQIRGDLPGLVAPLEENQLSSPYRTRDHLEIVQLLAREESEPIPLEKVRDRVAALFTQQYTRELYQEMKAGMFASGEPEIEEAALATLKSAALPQQDISVEDLERLLEAI